MNHFANNLKYLRKTQRLTQEKFSVIIGLKRSTYKDYEVGKTKPDFAVLTKIADHYRITIDELIREDIMAVGLENLSSQDKNSLQKPLDRVLTISLDKEGNENVDFVSTEAKAGYLEGYNDPEYLKDLQKIAIPNTQNGTYRAFPISGDSMEPYFPNGSIFVGKYVENIDYLKHGKTYVLATSDDGVVCKNVAKAKGASDKMMFYSLNPIYEPYFVDLTSIKEAWEFHALIQFDSPSDTSLVEKILDHVGAFDA
ncbi:MULTISPECIES: XRE family transcriptional regulator [Persicobacter]|uniref:Helix-turn-helix transcriptional regulator n=1 Tax=Persicobacter diffluens TaxID=981 RepID=A0AAN4VX32_9BACT|nr:LexA family transcriptional regulator [Persicobacter sp. CCB-QB2]GJM60512.1 helix-turn-helix transcriptional regulator [Persicobacter diffluens]